MPRTKLMAANWKMYKTPDQTREFFNRFLPMVKDHTRDEIAVHPPFVCIHVAVEAARGSNVSIGGQNMHWEKRVPSPAKPPAGCCSLSVVRM